MKTSIHRGRLLLIGIIALALNARPGSCIDSPKGTEKEKIEVTESIEARRKQRIATRTSWRQTFAEIRALTIKPSTSIKTGGILNQTGVNSQHYSKKNAQTEKWKVNLNSGQTRRFDGFADWEKKLQRWTERASDYFQYSSNFPNSNQTLSSNANSLHSSTDRNNPISFPITLRPKPAKTDEPILPHTDIGDKSKKIWIVTTAALPWMTGTAINPILRAAYLLKGRLEKGGSVTLMVPWLNSKEERMKVYGRQNAKFQTQQEQEHHIRKWLNNTANMSEAAQHLNIQWYPAWHNALENSVYSEGDITALIPEDQVDICVLEEPEHLNWYREQGESWTIKFKHVVGIVHTNYFVYAQEQPAAFIRAPGMRLLCSWMIRAHCHRVIKLSGTLGSFAPEKELIENVHGVRASFLDAGERLRQILISDDKYQHPIFSAEATPTIYFLGKMLWSKGLLSLMELLKYAEESADLKVTVDMYGGGPDKDQAQLKSEKLGLDMPFHGPIDHAALADTHKIFINPSLSEVLCTAVAEALAMGKFVVLPSHPSNDFFAQFPNCLPYATKEEFVGNLYYAMTHSPEPLSEEYSYALSWEAATERFEAAGSISVAEAIAYEQAVNASMADNEINLPPLIEDQGRRRKVTAGLRFTRSRFRQFRSKLSEEIRQSKVFPKSIEQKIVVELDKRLDLDLDEILNSPKLRFKLSPAELDAQLLDMYISLTQGPGSDAIRSILGGEYVLKQNLKSRKQSNLHLQNSPKPILNPESDLSTEKDLIPQKLVEKTLQRNFPWSYDDKLNGDALDYGTGSSTNNELGGTSTKMNMNAIKNIDPLLSRQYLPTRKWGGIQVRWRCSESNMIVHPISTNLKVKCR